MRPLPDLSIRQLEYLVAVAEEPSWALAAQRTGVSPSALSQGLAELERRVGVPLFERDGRRRRIRSAAAPAVSHARQVLALTNDLAMWSERLRDGHAGRLRLGMIDAAAVGHHPDILRAFRVGHPDVELVLHVGPSTPLLERLASGELDIVVCVDPPTSIDGIDIEPLLIEELAVYGPPGTAVGPPETWGPWVLFPAGSHTRTLIVDSLARLGAPIDVVGESHQPEVLGEMVRLGSGWTVLPTTQAERGDRPLTDGTVVTTRQLVIATRHGSVTDPAVDALASMLRQASTQPALSPSDPRS